MMMNYFCVIEHFLLWLLLCSSAVTGGAAKLAYKSAETAASKGTLLKKHRLGLQSSFHILKFAGCRVHSAYYLVLYFEVTNHALSP